MRKKIQIVFFSFVVLGLVYFFKYLKRAHSEIAAIESDARVGMSNLYFYQINYFKKNNKFDSTVDPYKFIRTKKIEICPPKTVEAMDGNICKVTDSSFIYLFKIKVGNESELWSVDNLYRIKRIE